MKFIIEKIFFVVLTVIMLYMCKNQFYSVIDSFTGVDFVFTDKIEDDYEFYRQKTKSISGYSYKMKMRNYKNISGDIIYDSGLLKYGEKPEFYEYIKGGKLRFNILFTYGGEVKKGFVTVNNHIGKAILNREITSLKLYMVSSYPYYSINPPLSIIDSFWGLFKMLLLLLFSVICTYAIFTSKKIIN